MVSVVETIIVNGITLKKYDDMYYVSDSGDVFSKYSHKFLKHAIDHDGYHRVDIHSKHMKIHKLVFETWNGKVPSGLQINHRDDDKNNNHIDNLYLGTQKENTADRIRNQHNIGNTNTLVVYDKEKQKTLVFCPANKFAQYSGHSISNGCIASVFTREWFKKRYKLIDYRKGVTTMSDECSSVGSEFIA